MDLAMTELYKPETFEPLTDEQWDENRVRDGIRAIVADADRAFDPEQLWPAHEWDAFQKTSSLKDLYVGACGVFWALDALRRRGHAETKIDLAGAALRTLEEFREHPDYADWPDVPSRARSALFTGETGPLLVAWRLSPSADLADELLERIRENVDSEAIEVMWGAPGTMLVAHAMLEWTGEKRWADAWRESAEAVWQSREPDGLWKKWLYGETSRSLGPPHGVVGNVLALCQGDLLPAHRRELLERETADVLARMAVVADGLANWPMAKGFDLLAWDEIRVQWCAGAPGIVISTAGYLDEELFLAGAELPWRTGPPGMEKGPGICHGTAGNGYAFLKAFERTGDELWLDRARRFAVHALGQVERRGHGRYSLWTGDVGVALFAADCLDARTAYPVMDSLDWA
ncbi:MAG TPA: LanC-like protein [Gaiellaceae bacterium]|nr:LanC-like protein [Gaiellaceae bacterium]